jgi:hypothetical protein
MNLNDQILKIFEHFQLLISKQQWKRGRVGMMLPTFFIAAVLLFLPAGSALLSTSASGMVPMIKILAVTADDNVTIRTYNFPPNQDFAVTMGPMGTRGVNGIVVDTINSGVGGTFDATFSIPQELSGSYRISIRLQTHHQFPYYAYNWFYNNTTGDSGTGGQPPGYVGIPTFSITAVEKDKSVTILTSNYPPNQIFTVTMGLFGSRGINGIVVGTLDSGQGGALVATYQIPAELVGQSRIAIRAQTSHAYPYYSYNWFWNNDAMVPDPGTGGQPLPEPPPTPGYIGIPTMWITAVVRDQSVTFQTNNYPANQTFTVTMGPMGTRGINGFKVGEFNSGVGGSFSITVPIAGELAGSNQISIRAQTAHAYPYYSYNWFFNNSTQ